MSDSGGHYVIYLRKSRADAEAESRGEGETLLKHEKALIALAQRKNFLVAEIYREIVSGETIAARPLMQKLLGEVGAGRWAGVLVMEVERLARGDTIDQGVVAQTFKYSGTKIITPNKTYNPLDEFDEEYFEFGLFMSRREYKAINRRLQRGREASAREGRYQGSRPPYGYKKTRSDKNEPTLAIIPEQAVVVRLIFEYYVHGEVQTDGDRRRLGLGQLARKLNELGITPATHDYWQKETLKNILTNPVYIGKIRWGYRKKETRIVGGLRVNTRPKHSGDEYILADGLHEAIVDDALFECAEKLWAEQPPMPVGYKNELKNPMAGLIICGKCGRKMSLRKGADGKKDYLVCRSRDCGNVSAPINIVEKRLVTALSTWLSAHKLDWSESTGGIAKAERLSKTSLLETAIARLAGDCLTLDAQLSNAHDLVEQNVYTTEHFLMRAAVINERIRQNESDRQKLSRELDAEKNAALKTNDCFPHTEKIMDVYAAAEKAGGKNLLLRIILEKAVYIKNRGGAYKGASSDDFELVIFPKL